MFDNATSSGSGILRKEAYLTTDYEPQEPVGRDTEIDRIADGVRPLSRRRTPENLLVYGPAGVGKTTCVKHVLNNLDQNTSVKTIYINCWQYNTRSSLLTELLIELGYPAPRKGKPVDELLSKISEWLDRNRGVAVALDEFDQLDDQTEVIYDLQMLNEEADNPLGLLMVSNRHPRAVKLDPRSRSRLNCQTLEFKPYTAPQLVGILEKRVEKAFRPGTVPNKVLEEIAEYVADNSGDCREALQILLRLGRKADRENRQKIEASHLMKK